MATIPSLALIPSGYKGGSPKGTLYSVLPTDGTCDFDFTRSGNATRVNSEGLIELVTSNVPRLNYPLIDGVVSGCPSLLLEPQRTNLVQYSEDFSDAYWTKATSDATPVPVVTSNYAISPDGTQNAERVQLTLPTDNQYANLKRAGINPNATVGSTIYQSIYLKATDISQVGKKVDVLIYDQTNASYRRIFNHVLTNDWERIESNNLISFGSTCTSVEYVFGKARANAAGQDGTTGTITSEAATDFLVWGAQLESGSIPTSYIPTSGATATRVVDNLLGQLTTGFFNDNEGTLFLHFKAFENDTSYRYLAISDGTVSNRVVITLDNTYRIQSAVSLAGVTQSNVIKQMTNGSLSSGFKVAMTYKNNEFKSFVNGVETTPRDTSGSVFPTGTLKYLRFTQGNTTSGPLNGETKQLQYFDTALNDTSLEELTSWRSFNEMARDLLYTIE